MPVADIPPLALIADAHYHCVDSHYGVSFNMAGKPVTLRSWADTRISSRVFNESDDALNYTLADIAHRGIRHVALLGDYTDDGQIEATRCLVELLLHYQKQYGIAFYALPGNHDVYGPLGKHQSTRFVNSPAHTVLVTSDPEVAASEPETAVHAPAMYCQGYSEALQAMAHFGYFNSADYFHWETPFGTDDAEESRLYSAWSADGQVTHQLMDASYLVEPVLGLWLLMIDANVFEPRNGHWHISQKKAFLDSSDAGWNSVLPNKPHLIGWISDVCSRAQTMNKKVVACSHYPVLDVFNDYQNTEARLFGHNDTVRRRPAELVGRAVAATGLTRHFSGHLHVNGQTRLSTGDNTLTEFAVPSIASFPPAYQVVDYSKGQPDVQTVTLYDMPLNQPITDHYKKKELAHRQEPVDKTLDSKTYGEFLHRRVSTRVRHRHLAQDWPELAARHIQTTTTADLAIFLLAQRVVSNTNNLPLPVVEGFKPLPETVVSRWRSELSPLLENHQITFTQLTDCSMMSLVADWYCLRQAGDQSSHFIDAGHLALYRFLAESFGSTDVADDTTECGFFTLFLGAMQQYLSAAGVAMR